jgi:hypothetical protein
MSPTARSAPASNTSSPVGRTTRSFATAGSAAADSAMPSRPSPPCTTACSPHDPRGRKHASGCVITAFSPLGRVCRPGGGRRKVTELGAGLRPALLALVEPDERVDPMPTFNQVPPGPWPDRVKTGEPTGPQFRVQGMTSLLQAFGAAAARRPARGAAAAAGAASGPARRPVRGKGVHTTLKGTSDGTATFQSAGLRARRDEFRSDAGRP